MKSEQLYNKTVGILVDAYMNDTLKHGMCTHCAVGNIICGNMYDGNMTEWWKNYSMNNGWANVFQNGVPVNLSRYKGEPKKQIDSTGYSVYELAAIESAFELANTTKEYNDENMFNGLMAVIDVLDKIHENTDSVVTVATKSRFAKSNIL
jgi:hypothetical protein